VAPDDLPVGLAGDDGRPKPNFRMLSATDLMASEFLRGLPSQGRRSLIGTHTAGVSSRFPTTPEQSTAGVLDPAV